jgi:hypothetical protein
VFILCASDDTVHGHKQQAAKRIIAIFRDKTKEITHHHAIFAFKTHASFCSQTKTILVANNNYRSKQSTHMKHGARQQEAVQQ